MKRAIGVLSSKACSVSSSSLFVYNVSLINPNQLTRKTTAITTEVHNALLIHTHTHTHTHTQTHSLTHRTIDLGLYLHGSQLHFLFLCLQSSYLLCTDTLTISSFPFLFRPEQSECGRGIQIVQAE